jgi:tetratricopeptide (TPR) repeat protein
MKLHYMNVFVVAGLLGAMPAHAAGAAAGKTPAASCFDAAQTVSHAGALDKDALANCTEALSNKMSAKDRIATLINRGTIEAASGDITSSLADYGTAIAMNPNMPDTYINRGTTLMRAARYEEARASFDQAVSLAGTNTHVAYFNRALVEEKLGNIRDAYRDYKRAAALAPDYQPAKKELARFRVVPRGAGES